MQLPMVLLFALCTSAHAGLTAPDAAAEVKIESKENIQIHDVFAAQEKKSEEQEKQVKADKDLSALLQLKATPSDVADKVALEGKQNIQIHDVFAEEEKQSEE